MLLYSGAAVAAPNFDTCADRYSLSEVRAMLQGDRPASPAWPHISDAQLARERGWQQRAFIFPSAAYQKDPTSFPCARSVEEVAMLLRTDEFHFLTSSWNRIRCEPPPPFFYILDGDPRWFDVVDWLPSAQFRHSCTPYHDIRNFLDYPEEESYVTVDHLEYRAHIRILACDHFRWVDQLPVRFIYAPTVLAVLKLNVWSRAEIQDFLEEQASRLDAKVGNTIEVIRASAPSPDIRTCMLFSDIKRADTYPDGPREMKVVFSRVGVGSNIIFSPDFLQTDWHVDLQTGVATYKVSRVYGEGSPVPEHPTDVDGPEVLPGRLDKLLRALPPPLR